MMLAGLIGYPVLYSLWLSFHRYQLNMPSLGRPFVGFDNYLGLLQDKLLIDSVAWTLSFAAISVPLEFGLGLLLALLLNAQVLGRARDLVRGVMLSPMMLAGILAGFTWRMMFDPEYGPVNHLLGLVGIEPISWFTNAVSARAAVIVAEVWLTTPFVTLVLMAGMQSIPEDLYEAARMDGATSWRAFRHITLPLLRYSILTVLIVRSMDALRSFELAFILTQGGPGTATTTAMYYDYQYAFTYHQMGRSSALSFVILLGIMLITAIYNRLLHRDPQG